MGTKSHGNVVNKLLDKAVEAKEASHALAFSQAACNAANALRVQAEALAALPKYQVDRD